VYSKSVVEPVIFGGFAKGHRFGLWILPSSKVPRAAILAIQTSGEENNFSRRVMIQAAHRFAELGFATLIFDPYGVGDSAGQTSQMSLKDWRRDLMSISHQIRLRYDVPFYVWGARLGSLLAADLLISQSDNTSGLLLWSPLAHGRTWVDQLTGGSSLARVISKVKARRSNLLDEYRHSPSPESSSTLWTDSVAIPIKEEMSEGSPLATYLGGCRYRQSTLEELKRLSLAPVKQESLGSTVKVGLIGIVSPISAKLEHGDLRQPPALVTIASNWAQAGYRVFSRAVACEPFWSSGPAQEPVSLYEASEQWLVSTFDEKTS
jgi:pimeloyl-ACP methyl ester carboxylesterase